MGACNWGCTSDCAANGTWNDTCGSGSCTGTCQGVCGGGCSGCDDTCEGSCAGGCSDNCAGSCTASCTGACKGGCGKGCNTGCTSNEALDLYQKLEAGLHKKIYAADMQNINKMIEHEASSNRFNKTITSINFVEKSKANSSEVIQLQNNLIKIGQTISQNANPKVKSWKATGEELIKKAQKSFNTTINSNATG